MITFYGKQTTIYPIATLLPYTLLDTHMSLELNAITTTSYNSLTTAGPHTISFTPASPKFFNMAIGLAKTSTSKPILLQVSLIGGIGGISTLEEFIIILPTTLADTTYHPLHSLAFGATQVGPYPWASIKLELIAPGTVSTSVFSVIITAGDSISANIETGDDVTVLNANLPVTVSNIIPISFPATPLDVNVISSVPLSTTITNILPVNVNVANSNLDVTCSNTGFDAIIINNAPIPVSLSTPLDVNITNTNVNATLIAPAIIDVNVTNMPTVPTAPYEIINAPGTHLDTDIVACNINLPVINGIGESLDVDVITSVLLDINVVSPLPLPVDAATLSGEIWDSYQARVPDTAGDRTSKILPKNP